MTLLYAVRDSLRRVITANIAAFALSGRLLIEARKGKQFRLISSSEQIVEDSLVGVPVGDLYSIDGYDRCSE